MKPKTVRYENILPIENNFQVKVKAYENYGGTLPHWHEHMELLYFKEGSCTVNAGANSLEVKSGDLVVINGAEVHSVSQGKPISYDCILIYPQFFSDVAFDGVRLSNLIRGDSFVGETISQMQAEQQRRDFGFDLAVKSLAYRLVVYLMRNYTVTVLDEKEREKRSLSISRIDGILKYISENYSQVITTAELASFCYLSEAHFCRFFKKETGKTCMRYINEFRVEKAALMLNKTDFQISAVASAVGFDDVNYFSRIFKQIKGISPSSFRAK